jgi:hypothetical protein
MCFPILGGCGHLSIIIACICKAEITLKAIFVPNRKTVQDCCDGRGRVRLNNVSNLSSLQQCRSGLLPNDLDGMSVIGFFTPGMCTSVSGQVFAMLRHSASALTSCAKMHDFRHAISSTQPILGVLLLNRVTSFVFQSLGNSFYA